MEPKNYILIKIDGEYAILKPLDATDENGIYIALALLPAGADVGTKLRCVIFSISSSMKGETTHERIEETKQIKA